MAVILHEEETQGFRAQERLGLSYPPLTPKETSTQWYLGEAVSETAFHVERRDLLSLWKRRFQKG